MDKIRRCTFYEGKFKEDATRWITESVEDTADPRLEITVRQTYAAAGFAAGKLARLSFTDHDADKAIFAVASHYHWRQYIKEVAAASGVPTRMWKRITRNRIRAQQHQLNHIRNGTLDRLFFDGGQIPFDPDYVATADKKRRNYGQQDRNRRALKARKKAERTLGPLPEEDQAKAPAADNVEESVESVEPRDLGNSRLVFNTSSDESSLASYPEDSHQRGSSTDAPAAGTLIAETDVSAERTSTPESTVRPAPKSRTWDSRRGQWAYNARWEEGPYTHWFDPEY